MGKIENMELLYEICKDRVYIRLEHNNNSTQQVYYKITLRTLTNWVSQAYKGLQYATSNKRLSSKEKTHIDKISLDAYKKMNEIYKIDE